MSQYIAATEGCVAKPLQAITAILLWSKYSSLLMRIVLQDAFSDVMKTHPPLKLRVFFVDDHHGFHKWEENGTGEVGRKGVSKVQEGLRRRA